jgi:DNA-binding response OmpR family regulator
MEREPTHVVILVIEDDPLVRELLQNVLTEEGYQAIAATTGAEALTAMTTVMPHLITLDLDLPGITGDVILKELRQRDDTRDLPIVIISAKHPIPAEVRKLAQAVLPKPFDLDKLIATIEKLIPPPAQEHTPPA